jgi:hypothetical protein
LVLGGAQSSSPRVPIGGGTDAGALVVVAADTI